MKLSIISPKIAKSNRMQDATRTDLLATMRRSVVDKPCVNEKKIGVNPIGSTITKSVTREVMSNVGSTSTHLNLHLMPYPMFFVISPKFPLLFLALSEPQHILHSNG